MLELNGEAGKLFCALERVSTAVPTDTNVKKGVLRLYQAAGIKLRPFSFRDTTGNRVSGFSAFFDNKARSVAGPRSPEVGAVLLGEAVDTDQITRQVGQGKIDFAVVDKSSFQKQPGVVEIADLDLPSTGRLTAIPAVLVSSQPVSIEVFARFENPNASLSLAERIMARLLQANRAAREQAERLNDPNSARRELLERDFLYLG